MRIARARASFARRERTDERRKRGATVFVFCVYVRASRTVQAAGKEIVASAVASQLPPRGLRGDSGAFGLVASDPSRAMVLGARSRALAVEALGYAKPPPPST